MITMQNHWQSNAQEELFPSSKDISGQSIEVGHSTLFVERSISAPPPTGMGFDLSENSLLLGLGKNQSEKDSSNNGNLVNSGPWGTENQLFGGRNEPAQEPRSLNLDPFAPPSRLDQQHVDKLYDLDSNRQSNSALGDTIIRPRSAAPQFPDRPIVPPGMNLSRDQGNVIEESSKTSSFPDYDSIHNGIERPASTGLSTQTPKTSSSVMESLGLITADRKTVMDRIQEDFPRTPSPPFANGIKDGKASPHMFQRSEQNYYPDSIPQQSKDHQVSAPRNAPAPSSSAPAIYESVVEQNRVQSYNMNGTLPRKSVEQPATNHYHTEYPNQQSAYPRAQNFHMQHMPPSATSDPYQPQHAGVHQHTNYEAQVQPQMYYDGQQRKEERPQMPPQYIRAGTNAPPAVYVNPVPFPGYTAVYMPDHSYPHAVPNHVVHPHDPNIAPAPVHAPEYISVPIQHEMPRVAGITPNGAYVYYPQHLPIPNQPPTVAVVDSNGRPTTIAMPTIPAATMAPAALAKPTKPSGKSPVLKSQNERTSRKSKGKKSGSASGGLDTSKHSISSFNCSSLLEEFRSSKNRSWSMFDIQGHIVEFCQDQNGSRFIQQRLEEADDSEKQLVMAEVLPSVRRLRNDVFGNYVVQKLFDNGNDQMKTELKKTLEGEMLTLSTQMYGCRVVQKALECLKDDSLIPLLSEFHENIVMCIHDQNGNHVIQKYIEITNKKIKNSRSQDDQTNVEQFKKEIKIIVDSVLEIAPTLSCHPYGCRVLQRILEHCVDEEKSRTLDTILKYHRVLLDDQYGNYVIQHVLQFGRNSDRESIAKIVIESGLLALSRQKFASNVVEKLLKYGSPKVRNMIVREMLKVVEGKGSENDGKGSSVVLLMVRDAYANYVVQTTIDVVPEGQLKQDLLDELNRNAALLRNYTFAKHIVSKLGDVETKTE